MKESDIECPLCFTYARMEYYQPEWSDIPTMKFFSCRCVEVEWQEELTQEDEIQFYEEQKEIDNS